MFRKLECFKAYDVRGIIDLELDDDACYRIARAFSIVVKATTVVIGYDARATSKKFAEKMIEGLIHEGVDVLELGLCGTEEVYHATVYHKTQGGIQVTASHNPINYNGFKLVKANSAPLNPENEFKFIKKVAEDGIFEKKERLGKRYDVKEVSRASYVEQIVSFAKIDFLRNKKIVVNCGNGAAGPTFDAIMDKIKSGASGISIKRILHQPDAAFPSGIPNPLLVKNQALTSTAVLEEKADMGIAFDGDFDRCFFFDENGMFVSSEYIVGILAEIFLKMLPNATIVHDGRVVWNTLNIIKENSGRSVVSKTGHAFIKEKMRETKAIYGGEMSAHHYFRDFHYCDSGMVPWLLILELLCTTNRKFSSLIKNREEMFPSSGEVNFEVNNQKLIIEELYAFYSPSALSVDYFDGMSYSFSKWRFNIRSSNTEPVLRLNVETDGDKHLLNAKVREISRIISKFDKI